MTLPTVEIAGLEISRLLLGGNPVSGFSHLSPEATEGMLNYFTAENVKALLRRCEECGITAAVMRADNHVIRLLREYWNEGGTIRWIAQTAPEEEHLGNVDKAVRYGASAVSIHGGWIDTHFARGAYDDVRVVLDHIRSHNVPAGCASHVPAHHLEMVRREWPLDFHMVCLHNLAGYRGKLGTENEEEFSRADREIALDTIARIERPCIAYKILGAGRYEAEPAFRETFDRIKPTDAVTVGMYPPDCTDGDIVEHNVAYAEKYGTNA